LKWKRDIFFKLIWLETVKIVQLYRYDIPAWKTTFNQSFWFAWWFLNVCIYTILYRDQLTNSSSIYLHRIHVPIHQEIHQYSDFQFGINFDIYLHCFYYFRLFWRYITLLDTIPLASKLIEFRSAHYIFMIKSPEQCSQMFLKSHTQINYHKQMIYWSILTLVTYKKDIHSRNILENNS